MITIGCAGFPVPATRYFKEFLFVEVQETHVALPGTGTIRRWRREAPAGFAFAMLAPREIGQEGFREGKVVETALKSLIEVGKELDAKTAVFVAPPEFTASRGNKAAVKEFLAERAEEVRARRLGAAAQLGRRRRRRARDRRAASIAARDPLAHGTIEGARRLLPPARARRATRAATRIRRSRSSPRSRATAKHKDATYVFTNVDMFADAKRFKKAMKQ